MALTYHPQPGEILLCNYSTGFVPPEMTKLRPVVIVSPRLRRRNDLVSVVPLSTTEPVPVELHQCAIVLLTALPAPYNSTKMWAKCDMIATVALSRLDRFRAARKSGSSGRHYVSGQLDPSQMLLIRRAILYSLGFALLTIHL